MIYGYARCSTSEDKQDIQRQIRELKAAGAEEVIFECEYDDAKVKQNLNMLLESAQEQDTIITLEISRLSRWQYRPHVAGLYLAENCVCRTGAVHYPRPCEIRNSKCEGQGEADRQTADDKG